MTALHGIHGIDVEAPRHGRAERRAQSEDFSYAMAAASLEKSAGQSLKTHGAREQGPSADAGKPADEAAKAAAPRDAGGKEETLAAKATGETSAHESSTGNAQRTPTAAPPTSPASATPAPTGAASPVLQSVAGKPGEAAIARAETDVRSKAAALKGPKPAPTPSTAQADFAEILARRLDKQSVFDLRLDPASMGRVEGRLLVEDGGKAVLALAFDNQAALDFYARDQEALRLALSNSGFDFAEGDFVFRLREQRETGAEVPALKPIALDPSALAGFSDRAIDIRV